jgi:beta-galactosidase
MCCKLNIFGFLFLTFFNGNLSFSQDKILNIDFSKEVEIDQSFGGSHSISNGVCTVSDRPLQLGENNWDNYRVQFKAKCLENNKDGQIWFSFRYKDDWNRYAIAVRGGLLNDIILYRYKESDGSEPDIDLGLFYPLGFEFENNKWYNFQVSVSGELIKVKVGDVVEPQLVFRDQDELTSGAIALGGSWHQCQFDDIVVESVDADTGLKDFDEDAIRINFAPADVCKNYHGLCSDGSVYNIKKGFGWDKDFTKFTRNRAPGKKDEYVPLQNRQESAKTNVDSQATLLSIAHNAKSGIFKYKIPNGKYYVTPVVGDKSYPSHFEVYHNEKLLAEKELSKNQFSYESFPVTVTDGFLELKFVSDHPQNDQGLSLTELIIENWDKAHQRQTLIAEKKQKDKSKSENKELLRKNQRKSYEPIKVKNNQISLEGQWLFKPDYELAEDETPYSPNVSDEKWHLVTVPSFWNPISFWNLTGNRGQAYAFRHFENQSCESQTFEYQKTTSGWYRQWIELPANSKDSKLIVDFDAVAISSMIYFNGKFVGQHLGMFGSFSVDLTKYAQWGVKNLLAVYVSSKTERFSEKIGAVAVSVEITEEMLKSIPRGFYNPAYDGQGNRVSSRPAGIWQPVNLRIESDISIKDVFFKPRLDGADIDVEVDSQNFDTKNIYLSTEIAGTKFKDKLEVKPGSNKYTIAADVENIKYWTPEHPNLYQLKIEVLDKKRNVLSEYSRQVGFRTIETRGKYIFMNDKPYWLGGANMGPIAIRPNDKKVAEKFLQYMHDSNQRIMRSHGMPIPQVWADAADSIGVGYSSEGVWPWLMINNSEIPAESTIDQHKQETIEIIKALRNHPSILVWTVGNEQYFMDDSDPERKKKKWQHFNELVQLYRKYDGTRPIILTSGYVAHKQQADYVKANGFDDGDIADPHLYSGWYGPSVFSDQYHNGRYLPETDKPIMSQEASTGYPNDDTGTSEFHYIKLFVPQIWVGDQAYPDRDPAVFLKHQAIVTKEWIEDVRRTRKTAGWMMFSNTNWFKNDWSSDYMEPYPVYNATKFAYDDTLISADFRNRHYFNGDTIAGKLVTVNDSSDFKDLSNTTCIISLIDKNGKELSAKTIDLPDCSYFENSEANFSIQVPENTKTPRQNCKLKLKLLSGRIPVSENEYNLLICNRNWAKPSVNPNKEITLLHNGVYNEFLDEYGISYKAGIRDTIFHQGKRLYPDKEVVVLSGVSVPKFDSNRGRILLDFVARGGQLVLLETAGATALLNDTGVKEFIATEVEFANMEIPGHPIFKDMELNDLKWWNSPLSGPKVANGTYRLNLSDKNIIPIAENIDTHAYGWKGPKTYPCFIYNYGKGQILVSELRTSRWNSDPLACKSLSNIINWMFLPN